MKISNHSDSDRGAASHIVINSVSNYQEREITKKKKPLNWRKLLLVVKDVGAIVLVLVQILRELGLM
ncbi:hypothetical protein NIES2101_43260 [Calothrix sp. HK-06]|nr:hypothetical protein NIES2101_43260 [Calothrix sp. HK-06]